MNIMTYLKKGIFYAYMAFVIFTYTRPVSIGRYTEETSGLDLDKIFHFFTFLLLGILAKITNNRKNDNIYAVTLALIVSLFIELTHFVIPYRDFEILDGLLNIVGCVVGIAVVNYYIKRI